MNRISLLTLLTSIALIFSACGGENKSGNEGDGKDTAATKEPTDTKGAEVFEKGGLKVYPLSTSPEYKGAELVLEAPPRGASLEAGENSFDFNVDNYELGVQTADAEKKGIANSGKGQHIHFILNNGPYSAYYESEFKHSLEDGHYVMLSFLSRSYHESVKAPNAYALQQFVVGQPGNFKEANLGAPHMFYSRPKGTYKGADIKKLMLDFYLVNCDLSPDGYKVKATINGNEFMLTKWQPYVIEGLEPGEVSVSLELIDAAGTTVNSPFNPVNRKVMLEAE